MDSILKQSIYCFGAAEPALYSPSLGRNYPFLSMKTVSDSIIIIILSSSSYSDRLIVAARRRRCQHLTPPLTPLLLHLSASLLSSSISQAMDGPKVVSSKELHLNVDPSTDEEYASLSELLLDFINFSNIDKAWVFQSGTGKDSKAMFSISQPNLLSNKKRRFLLSAFFPKDMINPVAFQWSPFPVEVSGASLIIPSPSGSKLLIVRNAENDSPTKFEIWSPSDVEKEFQIPKSVHGSVYADGWFEGVSWNSNETLVAYVAEEPNPSKPTFNHSGYKTGGSTDKDCNSWKGQGDWEEGWGETYANKRRPTLFVLSVNSGEVRAVESIRSTLSVGQVVWAPATEVSQQHLVFVGWSSTTRKLGIKYCYNRTCSLYAVPNPFSEAEASESAQR
ncbi:hypothetical protein Dimus_037063 [Dionaea muscipula]